MKSDVLNTDGTPVLDAIHNTDALELLRALPDGCVNCCVTSPPYYGLRDYGTEGQIGLEDTPQAFVARLVVLFEEVRRVLRDDGVLWLNLGDTYSTHNSGGKDHAHNFHSGDIAKRAGISLDKPSATAIGLPEKNLIGIPWRVAFALQDAGWWLRSDIIWHKPNPMPESVTDRPTVAHEYVFLMTKSARYWYDADAIREEAIHAGREITLGDKSLSRGQARGANILPSGNGKVKSVIVADGRNRRTVWTVPTEPKPFQHFAMFPQALIEPMILAGSPVGGVVLDPFMGSGTTALVAQRLGRHYLGCDLNPEYVELARKRLEYRGDDKRMVAEQAAGVQQIDMFDAPAPPRVVQHGLFEE